MKEHNRGFTARLSLVVVMILALLLTACSTPVAGSATPASQETTVNTPRVASVATATVKPPVGQIPTGDYPVMPATPVITVTIEAYPTP